MDGSSSLLPDAQKEALLVTEEKKTNASKRYEMYRQMVLLVNGGPMGKGNRMQLPECVVNGIRARYPEDAPEKYTGHKDS